MATLTQNSDHGYEYTFTSRTGYFDIENSPLLFRAKILPNSNRFCLHNINSEVFDNIFIGECITVDLHNRGWGRKTCFIGYTSDTPIAGFQFNADGVTVNGASGGAAGEAGFMVSTSSTTVIGFSLTGTTIPAGEGVLLQLEYERKTEHPCLQDIVISDSAGKSLNYTVEDCHILHIHNSAIYGCTDLDACNYDVHASEDDGSCDYPSNCYDCDGRCICGVDCAGDCGGKSEVDRCGVCNGDGSSCK